MFWQFHYWNIEKIIRNFIEENNLNTLDFQVKWAVGENRTSRGAMTYRFPTKTILFNHHRMNDLYESYPFFTPDEFIILAFLHELGHHLHWQNETEYLLTLKEEQKAAKKRSKETTYVFEKGAWDYGKKYVPENLKEKFDLLNMVNLQHYVDDDEKTDILLDKQLAYYNSLEINDTISLTKTSLNKVMKWKKSSAVNEKKSEIVDVILQEFKNDTPRLINRYYNEMIFHVVKDDNEYRLIMQSLYEYENLKVYKLIESKS